MKILVTGGTGRVGTRLLEELRDQGNQMVSLDIRESEKPLPGISYRTGSITDIETVEEAIDGIEAVIHLSALMSWNAADEDKMQQVNVDGTKNLLHAATRQDIKRFVFASSGEVYPESRAKELPVVETHPKQPHSWYGLTKHIAEELVLYYYRVHSLPATILRLSHTQDATELFDRHSFFSGARFYLKQKLLRARQSGNRELIERLEVHNDGKEKMVVSCGNDGTPFKMHITETRDIVQGIDAALHRPQAVGECFNIGSDDAVSFDDLITRMSKYTGLSIITVKLPVQAVNYQTSNEKAKRLLKFQPVWDVSRMLEDGASGWDLEKDAAESV